MLQVECLPFSDRQSRVMVTLLGRESTWPVVGLLWEVSKPDGTGMLPGLPGRSLRFSLHTWIDQASVFSQQDLLTANPAG